MIATASPKNFDLLKSLGADAVYNYADSETPSKVAEDYPSLARGLDCVSEKGTTALLAKSFAGKKGKIITILPVKDEALAKELPEVHHDFILVHTVLGDAFQFVSETIEVNDDDVKGIEEWYVSLSVARPSAPNVEP